MKKHLGFLLCLMLSTVLCTVCPSGQTIFSGDTTCKQVFYRQGCFTYSNTYYCSVCQPNYNLISGRCIFNLTIPPSECCVKFNSNGSCEKCKGGLQLVDGACRDIYIPGCVEKDGAVCLNCAFDFELDNGKCVRKISGCQKYSEDGYCDVCIQKRTSYGSYCMFASQSGCAGNSTSTSCSACNPPFTLLNNLCSIPGCRLYSQQGCTACQPNNYLLENNTCQIKVFPNQNGSIYNRGVIVTCIPPLQQRNNACYIQGCLEYDATTCNSCMEGMKLVDGVCKIDNCLEVKDNKCRVCEGGYHMRNYSCVKGNGVDNVESVCKECAEGFFLGNDNKCKVKLPGCVYDQGICAGCSEPFTFNSGQCLIDGCVEYTSTGCKTCQQPYVPESSICKIPFCLKAQSGKCLQCDSSYILRNSSCYLKDPNCIYNDSGICTGCVTTYHLVNDSCIKDIPGCLQYDTSNSEICKTCSENFTKTPEGICVKQLTGGIYINGTLVSCREPFTFVNKSCFIDGCLEYQNTGCKKCNETYTLDRNICKLPKCKKSSQGNCLVCERLYVAFKGVCQAIDRNCTGYNDQGECRGCRDPTYFVATDTNICLKKKPGCVYTGSNCSFCYAPFTLNLTGGCSIQGCLRFNYNGCESCQSPYTITSSLSCTIPNCVHTLNGLCDKCSPNYHLKNFSCEPNDPNCVQYFLNGTCSSCQKSFSVFVDGYCHFVDSHCKRFNLRKCLECDENYYVNKWFSCSKKIPSCKIYSNGKCVECVQKFYMRNNSSGICYKYQMGCTKVDRQGRCTECERAQKGCSYVLRNGRCYPEISKLLYNVIDLSRDWIVATSGSKGQQVVTSDAEVDLLPVSSAAEFVYSSVSPGYTNFNLDYKGVNLGWKGLNAVAGDTVGFELKSPETFSKIQVQSGEKGAYLKEFWIQYTLNKEKGWRRINKLFDASSSSNSTYSQTFSPVSATSIRIVVKSFSLWPNFRFQFYVFNSPTDSPSTPTQLPTYIQGLLSSKSPQTQANILGFYNPNLMCSQASMSLCWAGMDFSESKKITKLIIETPGECSKEEVKGILNGDGTILEYYVDYSQENTTEQFECYDGCRRIQGERKVLVFAKPIHAQTVRVHPTKWTGSPVVRFRFQWEDS